MARVNTNRYSIKKDLTYNWENATCGNGFQYEDSESFCDSGKIMESEMFCQKQMRKIKASNDKYQAGIKEPNDGSADLNDSKERKVGVEDDSPKQKTLEVSGGFTKAAGRKNKHVLHMESVPCHLTTRLLPRHLVKNSPGASDVSCIDWVRHRFFFGGGGKKMVWDVWKLIPEQTPVLEKLVMLPDDIDDAWLDVIERRLTACAGHLCTLARVRASNKGSANLKGSKGGESSSKLITIKTLERLVHPRIFDVESQSRCLLK
eukprot:gene288-9940_t